MQTRELIKRLQEADPSGQEEVCVDNHDIWFVSSVNAFYDGALESLIRDGKKIVGARRTRNGCKVLIRCLSIEEAIQNDPMLVIDYSELGQEMHQEYQGIDERSRKEILVIRRKTKHNHLLSHLYFQVPDLRKLDHDYVSATAMAFLIEKLEGVQFETKLGDPSIYDQEEVFWKKHIEICLALGDKTLKLSFVG